MMNFNTVEFGIEPFITHQLGIKLNNDQQICPQFISPEGCPNTTDCPLRHSQPSHLNYVVKPPLPHHPKERERAVTVCKHWLRALCKKGAGCEFVHEFDLRKMPDCWWFSKFEWCAVGEDCLYSHIVPATRIRQCPDYVRGFCRKGPICPMKHTRRIMCKDYAAGFCPRGPKCEKGHPKAYPLQTLPPALLEPLSDAELGPAPGYFGFSFERGPWENRRCGGNYGGGFAIETAAAPSRRPAPVWASDGAAGQGLRKDLSEVVCYKCTQRGHYANACSNQNVPGERSGGREKLTKGKWGEEDY